MQNRRESTIIPTIARRSGLTIICLAVAIGSSTCTDRTRDAGKKGPGPDSDPYSEEHFPKFR